MKLLLVLGSNETYEMISRFVKPLGFEIIRYYNVLKAMDNIDETDPTGIIISARDYPRHWKTMVQFVRAERPKSICPIIILKGNAFTVDDSTQASFLGVSGIVTESMDNPDEISRIQEILCRYLPTDEKRRARRYNVQPWQRLKMVFALPEDQALVTGELKTISTGGLSILPDNPSLMKDMFLDMELDECSLRAGDFILTPICRIARTGRIISSEFNSFPDDEAEVHAKYLENLPLLGLKIINQNKT